MAAVKRKNTTNLVIEIIGHILSRLCIEDVLRYRAVCKSWNRLTREPYFIQLQHQRAVLGKENCILLCSVLPQSCGIRGSEYDMYLVDEEEANKGNWMCRGLTKSSDSERSSFKIFGSSHGLFCIYLYEEEERNPLRIYNPISRDSVALPLPLERWFHIDLCCFGFDSMAKKFKVICIYDQWWIEGEKALEDGKVGTMGKIFTLGESEWRKLEFPFDLYYSPDHASAKFNYTVTTDDAFYCIG